MSRLSRSPAPVAEGLTADDRPALELDGLVKRFDRVTAVDGVDLSVRRGEFLTLLGASGSGKTTILRLVAGFTEADAGRILLDGRDISALSPARRGVGMVFQQYALFPHMTVADNIAYPLKRRRWSRADIAMRIEEMLELVQLAGYGGRYPNQLSGGQQQRVALARALSFGPELLLMDEPLGALDRALRAGMVEEIRRVHRESGTTIVYVTHDQEEALTLSQRIGIMRDGHLLQVDTPQELFDRPVSSYVATFFGEAALVPVDVLGHAADGTWRIRLLGEVVRATASAPASHEPPERALLAVRSRGLQLGEEGGDVALRATVQDVLYLGDSAKVICEAEGVGRVTARVDTGDLPGVRAGDHTVIGVRLRDATLVWE